MEIVPKDQLDALTLTRLHLSHEVKDQGTELGLPALAAGNSSGVPGASLFTANLCPGAGQTLALLAGHGVQPRAQLGGFGKAAQRGGGDDERVPHSLSRPALVMQHRVAVAVQSSRIPLVCHGDTRPITCCYRRDNGAIVRGVDGYRMLRPAEG